MPPLSPIQTACLRGKREGRHVGQDFEWFVEIFRSTNEEYGGRVLQNTMNILDNLKQQSLMKILRAFSLGLLSQVIFMIFVSLGILSSYIGFDLWLQRVDKPVLSGITISSPVIGLLLVSIFSLFIGLAGLGLCIKWHLAYQLYVLFMKSGKRECVYITIIYCFEMYFSGILMSFGLAGLFGLMVLISLVISRFY